MKRVLIIQWLREWGGGSRGGINNAVAWNPLDSKKCGGSPESIAFG